MFNNILVKEYSGKNEKPLCSYSYGSKEKVWWICNLCLHEWQARIGHRTKGSGCPRCGIKKMHETKAKKRDSIKITDPEVAKEWDDTKDINLVSRGSNKKHQWKCSNCKNKWKASPNCRCLLQQGCPYCSGRYATNENNLLVVRPDLAIEFLGDASLVCPNSRKKAKWKCSFCSHEWMSTVNNRSQGKGCPRCSVKNSKPQREIEECLIEKELSFIAEYRIPDCKNQRPLPFDFAVMNGKSLDCLIEYQGEQHFFPIWGKKNLQRTKNNDKIKHDYCTKNNIPLHIINYWEREKICQLVDQIFKTT